MKITVYNIYSQDNQVKIEGNNGLSIKSNNLQELLDTLYCPDTLNLVWDLDASVAPLLQLLQEDKLKKLNETSKCHYAPFNIFYSKTRTLILQPVTSFAFSSSLFGIAQYFPNESASGSLLDLVKKAEELLEALSIMGIDNPKKLSSPVAIFEEAKMKYMNLPTIYDMPQEAGMYAAECAGKLWTEAYKIGCWEEAFDYDIESSFPSIVAELPDFRYGKWIKSKNAEFDFLYKSNNEIFGFHKCNVTIYNNIKISPIIHVKEDGSLSTPVGSWETYLTTNEINFILKYHIGKVEIINGWTCNSTIRRYPMKQCIIDLLKYKESNNQLVAMLAKRMSVGIYGKFGEEYSDKFGKYYNPVWFAYTSTDVRLEVARFIYDNNLQDNVIHISTDGVLLDKELIAQSSLLHNSCKDRSK